MKTKSGLNSDLIIVKIIVIAVLVVVMLIPIVMIQSLIEEREDSQRTVQREITQKYGGNQCLAGPIMVLPYEVIIGEKDREKTVVTNYAYFLPEDFRVNGNVKPEDRSRSLYKTLVYQSTLNVEGHFGFPDYASLDIEPEQIRWKDAFLVIGVTDIQGIKNKVVFNVNGKPHAIQPGIKKNDVIASGLTINLPIDPEAEIEKYEFDFTLALNGTGELTFIPIGKENYVQLLSPWKTVSFTGDFLPGDRDVNEKGFDAVWEIFDYNRNYIPAWKGANDMLSSSEFGVNLIYPVDQYQMTMRSVKYAIMFIALTFVVFFLIELLSNKRIHPVQYALVSFALVLFYTLLLALSEQMSFWIAYLASAAAITILITAYSISMFKSKKQAFLMGIFLVILYSYLYIILQLENLSLLFGAVGLFIALATVMYTLRKVNWYKPAKPEVAEELNVTVEEEKEKE